MLSALAGLEAATLGGPLALGEAMGPIFPLGRVGGGMTSGCLLVGVEVEVLDVKG